MDSRDPPPQRPGGRRFDPRPQPPWTDPLIGDYALPKTVGVNQIAYDAAWPFSTGIHTGERGLLDHFTTGELFDELGLHGMRSVRLWLDVPYWDGVLYPDGTLNPDPIFEDMRKVWEHPDIDVIVIVFTSIAHSLREDGCTGGHNMSWPEEPTYEIAKFFYEQFPDQDKIIIFHNPETDNQWRGFDCREPDEINFDTFWGPARQQLCLDEHTLEECVLEMAKIRFDYAIQEVERRQKEVQLARSEHPDATISVRTAMCLSMTVPHDEFFGMYALSRVKSMEYQPDYLTLSHWKGHYLPIARAILQIMRVSAYPVERIFIDQIGSNEKYPGKQYPVLVAQTHGAWDAGVNLVLVWMWRQTWHAFHPNEWPLNKGMWNWITTEGRVEWGDPTSGLGAIYELNQQAEEENE